MTNLIRFLILSFISSGLILSSFACTGTDELAVTPEPVDSVAAEPDMNERYERAQSLLSWNLSDKVFRMSVNPEWVSDQLFWYSVRTRNGTEYMLVDVARQTRSSLMDQEALAEALTAETENDIDPYSLPLNQVEYHQEQNSIEFSYDGFRWEFDLVDSRLEKKSELLSAPANSVMSPDGSKAAFIRDHNLWVMDMHSGEETQLTEDGIEFYGYATDSQGWTTSDRPVLKWSHDSSKISTYRLDERNVEIMHLLRTRDQRPELVSWPYAIPGDEYVPMHERVIIHVENGDVVFLDAEPDHQRTSNCCGLRRGAEWGDNEWSPDNEILAYVSTSRDYREVTLRIADATTGEVRDVYHERAETFFESNLTSRGVPNWRVLHGSNEFIWFTRKSQWGHLYLHDLETGELKNQITDGDWNVVDVLAVDEELRKIWFTTAGMDPDYDPYHEHLYSVNFDGSDLQHITQHEGNHTVWLSPGQSYLVNTFSDFVTPSTTVVRGADGQVVMTIEEADVADLMETAWTEPVPFVAKARDGQTDIYGLMYLPSDFDPEKSYPIVNNIYPGPQIGSVGTRNFSFARRGQTHALAELGFVVVQIDATGTPLRSKDFHTKWYGDMSDNGLEDQISAMRQLAQEYPFIDLARAGMYGHSGGGFATASAMFNHPDFFKVGVASAGNMDNRGYTFYWGEKYQGPYETREDGSSTFTNQALQYQVDGLEGKLLISYGTMDANVHPNTTLLLIDALIDHNKDFDLMVMPNRGHGYANEAYKLRRTWDYFVEHLKGVTPPREFDLSR